MKNKTALVTIALGEKFVDMFEQVCRTSWQTYCEVNCYDLIVLTKPLDTSPRALSRSPSWQKLLILSQDWSSAYEQIVWVDTDVLINTQQAKGIAEGVPKDKVGAVDEYSIPTRAIFDICLRRQYSYWRSSGRRFGENLTPAEYYENRGIPGGHLGAVVQAGIFVCSPAYHKELFEHIYYSYEDEPATNGNYEMPALSYELLNRNLVHWLSPQFNFCVSLLTAAFYPFIFNRESLRSIARKFGISAPLSRTEESALLNVFDLGYFIHFAGCSDLLRPTHNALQGLNSRPPSQRTSLLLGLKSYYLRRRRQSRSNETDTRLAP